MKILDATQVHQKIKRLAIQIHEHNLNEKQIILAGINKNGSRFAKLVESELSQLSTAEIILTRIRLNPASPLSEDIVLEMDKDGIKGKVVVVIDDVANTGRTLFYAFKPLMNILTKKVEVAVLVDRTHKSFPVAADYVGISLATTLNENIDVDISARSKWAVYLN